MSEKQGIDWSSLWKKEEWLAVWIGFLIIFLMLVGLKIKTPTFKWTTTGEFESYLLEAGPTIEELIRSVKEKGESGIEPLLLDLQKAMAAKDRKAVGEAAKKVEEAAKVIKDDGLKKKVSKAAKEIKGYSGQLIGKVFSRENIVWSIYLGIAYLILSLIAMALMGEKAGLFLVGFPVVYILAWLSLFLAGNYTINYYGLEYVLWCLFIGLFVSNVIGVPEWLKPAVKTEFYIKTGLVILGSGILIKEILEAGAYGIVQAVLVVAVIWYACYWFCRKLGIDEEFSAMLSSGVSICGVSAAIATSGAVKGDPKKIELCHFDRPHLCRSHARLPADDR